MSFFILNEGLFGNRFIFNFYVVVEREGEKKNGWGRLMEERREK